MNCPYCNEEMEKGYIKGDGRRGLYWLPEGEDFLLHTARNIKKHNGVVLSKAPILLPMEVLSHVCKKCHKVITDYED